MCDGSHEASRGRTANDQAIREVNYEERMLRVGPHRTSAGVHRNAALGLRMRTSVRRPTDRGVALRARAEGGSQRGRISQALVGKVVVRRVSSGPQAAQEAHAPPAPPWITAPEAFGAEVQSINPRLEAMTVSTMPMRRSMSWERRPILRT